MSTSERPDVSTLRTELARVAKITDVAERALELVAIVESVGAPMGVHPVLVGGMAVYFWTGREEFFTHDIDVVMPAPDELALKLAELGFVRALDKRHWTLPDTEIFLEAPSSYLDSDAESSRSSYAQAERRRSSREWTSSWIAWTSSRPPVTKRPRSRP